MWLHLNITQNRIKDLRNVLILDQNIQKLSRIVTYSLKEESLRDNWHLFWWTPYLTSITVPSYFASTVFSNFVVNPHNNSQYKQYPSVIRRGSRPWFWGREQWDFLPFLKIVNSAFQEVPSSPPRGLAPGDCLKNVMRRTKIIQYH